MKFLVSSIFFMAVVSYAQAQTDLNDVSISKVVCSMSRSHYEEKLFISFPHGDFSPDVTVRGQYEYNYEYTGHYPAKGTDRGSLEGVAVRLPTGELEASFELLLFGQFKSNLRISGAVGELSDDTDNKKVLKCTLLTNEQATPIICPPKSELICARKIAGGCSNMICSPKRSLTP